MTMKPEEPVIRQTTAARRIHRGRLFRKYFLLILALVCGVLLVSGAISVYFSYQENKSALARLQHEKAVRANKKKFVFEGPGKDHFIVLADADLEQAAADGGAGAGEA